MFIGLESINPETLKAAQKGQNRITEYRAMLQAWPASGALTYAGYILGFPADTPASIERDIRIIQRELPIDLLEFFILTPLPGSADHQNLHLAGVPMEPDLNRYDVVHVTTAPRDDVRRRAARDLPARRGTSTTRPSTSSASSAAPRPGATISRNMLLKLLSASMRRP